MQSRNRACDAKRRDLETKEEALERKSRSRACDAKRRALKT